MRKITVGKVILFLLLLFTSSTLAKAGESGLSLSYGGLFWDEEVGLRGSGCLAGELSHRIAYDLEIEGVVSYSNSKVRYKPTPFKNVNSWSLIVGVGYSWLHLKSFSPKISLGAGRLLFHKEGFDLEDYWVYQAKVGIRYQIKERLSFLVSYSHLLFRDEYWREPSRGIWWETGAGMRRRWINNRAIGIGLEYTLKPRRKRWEGLKPHF